MAKKSSLVDKALEVSRKNRVPKKPVKTKGKKTVPAVLDWGTGIPEDKLAYLNDDEMALVQAKREFKGKRSVDGVPAFPDPGDTAAGAKSSGPDRGPTGGPSRTSPSSGAGAGSGGLGGGGKGGAGGSPGGSPGAGGSNAGSSGGQSSPSGGAGGQKATPSSGPGGGSLSAPARTTPSSAPSSPAGFGPRQSNMPGNPVSTAPSTQSWQGAVDRIAQGSSVVGNPTGVKQFTDRVPQAAPKAVSYSQTPTVGPNRGLGSFPAAPGNFAQPDYSIGGNSPLSDPGVPSYDRNAQDSLNARAATRGLDTGILGPSVPAGTAIQRDPYFGAEQIANRFSGSMPSIGVNTTAYSAPIGPTLSQKLNADAQENIFSGSPKTRSIAVSAPGIGVNPNLYSSPVTISRPTTIAQDPSLAGRAASANTLGQRLVNASIGAANTIGDYAGSFFGGSPTMAAASAAINPQTGLPVGEKITDRLPGSESIPPGDLAKTPGKQFTDRIAPDPSFLEKNYPPQPTEAAYDLADAQEQQAMIRDALRNITGESLGLTRSATFPQETPTVNPSVNVQPASAPAQSYTKNPYNKSPAEQARDIRQAISIATAPPAASAAAADPVVMNTPAGPITQSQMNKMSPEDQQKLNDWKNSQSKPAKNPTEVNVPGYPGAQAGISPSQGDYSPSQAPAYDVSPSQQSGWTSAQRDAYLGSLGNSKTGQVQVSQNGGQPQGSPVVPAAPMTTLAPMPDWVDYSYLYNDYPQLALGATPNIGAFNQYNATFKRGGRVGDSIEAALRLALQGIVSRNKTS